MKRETVEKKDLTRGSFAIYIYRIPIGKVGISR